MFMRVFSILPPAACYLLSAVAVASTYYVYEGVFTKQSVLEQTLATDLPQPVDMDQFTGPTEFGEVAVIAQIRADWTHSLSVRDGNTTTVKVINYLVAPDASGLGLEALGALSVPSDKMNEFVAWLETVASGPSELGQIYTISGRVNENGETRAVKSHLLDIGVQAADGFVTIEPYLDGRVAALTPPPLNYTGYMVGGLIALLLAFLGYQRSIEERSNRRPRVSSTEVMSKLTPMAPGTADADLDLIAPRVTSKADPDSPLGRIQARIQSESLES